MILLKRSVIYMANNNGRFKNYVMSFSYKERRAKKLEDYKKMVCELKNMDRVLLKIA